MSNGRGSTDGLSGVFLGQALSICLTICGYASQVLFHRYGFDMTALLTTTVYSAVAIIFWLTLIHFSVEYFGTREFRSKIPATLMIALLDVSASIIAIHAVASVGIAMRTLLATFSTPTVIILSRVFLGNKYSVFSLGGATIAVAGAVLPSIFRLCVESPSDGKLASGN